jgi:hypothetical protein
MWVIVHRWPKHLAKPSENRVNKGAVGMGTQELLESIDMNRCDYFEKLRMLSESRRSNGVRQDISRRRWKRRRIYSDAEADGEMYEDFVGCSQINPRKYRGYLLSLGSSTFGTLPRVFAFGDTVSLLPAPETAVLISTRGRVVAQTEVIESANFGLTIPAPTLHWPGVATGCTGKSSSEDEVCVPYLLLNSAKSQSRIRLESATRVRTLLSYCSTHSGAPGMARKVSWICFP